MKLRMLTCYAFIGFTIPKRNKRIQKKPYVCNKNDWFIFIKVELSVFFHLVSILRLLFLKRGRCHFKK